MSNRALDFLSSLPGPLIHLTAINPQSGKISGRSYSKGNADDMTKCATAMETATANGAGLYFNVNDLGVILGPGKAKAIEAEVTTLNAFHVDADVPKDIPPEAFAKAKAELLTAIRGMNKPPSIIVDSGNGFGLFWMLAKPIKVTAQNRARLKAINVALRDAVPGAADACQNLDRVMRVPFTINFPNAAKLKRGRIKVATDLIADDRDFGVLYSPDDFEAAVELVEAAPVEPVGAIDIPENVDLSRLDADFVKELESGPVLGKAYGDGSRSGFVFYATCTLIAAGFTEGEIVGILTDPGLKVSEHILDQKQREPIATARKTYRDARNAGARTATEEFAADPIDPPTPELEREQEQIREANARLKPFEFGDRKRVRIVEGKLVRAMDEIQRIVGKQTDRRDPIFRRHGRLARLSRNLMESGVKLKHFERDAFVILDANKYWMATRLEKSIEFVAASGKDKETGKTIWAPINCPLGLVDRILGDSTNWLGYPALHATVETPTLRADGTILDKPGYDKETGLFYDPADVKFPDIEARPTIEQGKEAMRIVEGLLVDFPFADKVSKAVALSLLLTSVVRRSMDIAPVYGIDADDAEAGKTTLAKVGGALATGRDIEVQAYALNVEERDKLLPALLLGGNPYLLFDNLPDGCVIEGAEMEKVITSATYESRPFGKNDVTRTMPTNATMVFTGIKIGAAGAMTTRLLIVRLIPDKPLAERTFKHPDIVAYTIKHRPLLVAAILTALRCYIVHGTPVEKDNDRFPQWSKLIRSALIWYGYADPQRGGDALRENDPIKEAQREVIRQWWIKFADTVVTARDLARCAEVREAIADGNKIKEREVTALNAAHYVERLAQVRLGLPVEVVIGKRTPGHARKYSLMLKPSGRPDWAKVEETPEADFDEAAGADFEEAAEADFEDA